MYFNERPLIVADLETSGLDPVTAEIIEIAALRVDPVTLDVLDTVDFKVQFSGRIDFKAAEVNGYKPEDWTEAVSLETAMVEFNKVAYNGVLVSHNVTFEWGFLKEAFDRTGLVSTMDYHRLDLPSMFYALHPDSQKLNQDVVSEFYGVAKEVKPHRAINGAYQSLEILRKILAESN